MQIMGFGGQKPSYNPYNVGFYAKQTLRCNFFERGLEIILFVILIIYSTYVLKVDHKHTHTPKHTITNSPAGTYSCLVWFGWLVCLPPVLQVLTNRSNSALKDLRGRVGHFAPGFTGYTHIFSDPTPPPCPCLFEPIPQASLFEQKHFSYI